MKATRPSTGNAPAVQDSKPVPTFEVDGKALVLFPVCKDWGCKARDLGRLLSYADDGKKLVGKIGGAWSKEFIEGVDFVNEVHQVTTSGEPPRREMSLTRSGINLVCLKTRQPIGREIRQWLAREVMVQIADTGAYVAPTAEPPEEYYGRPLTEVERLRRRLAKLEAEVRRSTPLRSEIEDLRGRFEDIEGEFRGDIEELAVKVAIALRGPEQQPLALPAPKPTTNPKAVEAWGAAVKEAEAKLDEIGRVTNGLKNAVAALARMPRPQITPAPVPRAPLPDKLPHGGKYYYARLAPGALTRDMLAAPHGKDTILISESIWFAWLGGDVEAGREIGHALDEYGLAFDAVGATIARLLA